MSLNPPLKPFANGVLMARVITTSSAFLEVLWEGLFSNCLCDVRAVEAYIVDNPELPGVKCLMMEVSLSVILRSWRCEVWIWRVEEKLFVCVGKEKKVWESPMLDDHLTRGYRGILLEGWNGPRRQGLYVEPYI